MAAKGTKAEAVRAALKKFGLAYPGAHTKSPWPGHDDCAVKDKTFVYLSAKGEPLSIGCKLPHSSHMALLLPWVQPTPYGLGKAGWVTAKPPPDQAVDVAMFEQWIDESYRAQAPKTLVKQLDGVPTKPARSETPRPRSAPAARRSPLPRRRTPARTNKR